MIKRWIASLACTLALPLAVAAQDDTPAAAEHSEHEQHAPAAAAEPSGRHVHRPRCTSTCRRCRSRWRAFTLHRRPRSGNGCTHEHMQSMQQHMQESMGRIDARSRMPA